MAQKSVAYASGDASKKEYFKFLDTILRTNPKKKSDQFLEKAMGFKGNGDFADEKQTKFQCSLSKALKCNKKCVDSLNRVGENLASSFMSISESWKNRDEITHELIEATEKMTSMVIDAISLSRKIHENSLGLHVVVDFFRNYQNNPKILDFSRSGRITVEHFSSNEAITMCLTWLHTMAERLVKKINDSQSLEDTFESLSNMYVAFEEAILNLRDSSKLAGEVFRVLIYCNPEGKEMLRGYAKGLKPEEKNDLITELQLLRRQFDLISIVLERLGRSLANVLGRCTGAELTFENMLQSSQNELKKKFQNGTVNEKNKLPVKLQKSEKKPKGKVSLKGKESKSISVKKKSGKKSKKTKGKGLSSEVKFLAKMKAVLGIMKHEESDSGDQVSEQTSSTVLDEKSSSKENIQNEKESEVALAHGDN